jgi:hypothetical protein
MDKYVIINKHTGKLHRFSPALYTNMDMPVNPEVLEYVLANEELKDVIEFKVANTVLDAKNTVYDFDTKIWNIATSTVQIKDPKQAAEEELARLKLEANRYNNIPDLPSSLKLQITNYISELNAITIPETVVVNPDSLVVSWPTKPW